MVEKVTGMLFKSPLLPVELRGITCVHLHLFPQNKRTIYTVCLRETSFPSFKRKWDAKLEWVEHVAILTKKKGLFCPCLGDPPFCLHLLHFGSFPVAILILALQRLQCSFQDLINFRGRCWEMRSSLFHSFRRCNTPGLCQARKSDRRNGNPICSTLTEPLNYTTRLPSS